MAAPVIENLLLPAAIILVLPDGVGATTGTIFRRSPLGHGHFYGHNGTSNPLAEQSHILFAKDMAAEVIIDGIEYLAMHINAVVGLIKD